MTLPIFLKVLINLQDLITGLNGKPLTLNQTLKIYVLAERFAASADGLPDHLNNIISVDELSISLLAWHHMSARVGNTLQLIQLTLSLCLAHPPIPIPLPLSPHMKNKG